MAIVRTTSPAGDAPEKRTAEPVRTPGRPRAAGPLAARAGARTPAPVKPASLRGFFTDTITELRRVVWPTREEVRSGTIVTVGLLIFFAIYIFGLDVLANLLFHTLGLYGTGTPQGR